MKGLVIIIAIILAVVQLSAIPRMPGVGSVLNVLMPFLLVVAWYSPLWGIITALCVGFFELPYNSGTLSLVVLSFSVPSLVVALGRYATPSLHPHHRPFPYFLHNALGALAVLLFMGFRIAAGGTFHAITILIQASSMVLIFHILTWLLQRFYVKNIPKPFLYQ